MKKLLILAFAIFLTGCATHAKITAPVVSRVQDPAYDNKVMRYDILYTQPKPGFITGGEMMPLRPLDDAELSVASAKSLAKLPDYIFAQLPANMKRSTTENGDFQFRVVLVAHHKKGPTYADYLLGSTMVHHALTLGLGSDKYHLIADFDVTYSLSTDGHPVFQKTYNVRESLDHENGPFESLNSPDEYANQLFEKYMLLSLNDFFKEATAKLPQPSDAA